MHLRHQRGQSLIELLIGIAVGAIFVVGAVAAIVPSLRIGTQAGVVQMEAQLGQELLSNVKAWSNGNWGSVLAVATGTANRYYLNTATSPFTVVGTSNGESISSGGNSSYSYFRAITVASSTNIASGTQANFPMLVSSTVSSWASVSNGGHVQNLATAPNGGTEPADLIFTSDAGCSSPLSFETESYSSSTGALVDWVNLPSLSAGSVIYACYGSASVTTDQSHPSSTWNSNYTAVYHLPRVTNFGIDSTANGFNLGTSIASSISSGEIDGAASFDGSTQNMSSAHSVPGAFPYTMQAWVKLSSATINSEERYLSLTNAGIGEYSWVEYWENLFRMVTCTNSCSTLYYQFFTIPTLDTNWHDIYAVFNSPTSDSLYFDGQPATPGSNGGSGATMTNPNLISLGGLATNGEFPGQLDEARFTTNAPTPSWIFTEYNNQSNPSSFYAMGSEQTHGGSAGSVSATYYRYFYLLDVYRDANGNVTSTASGNYYDPSTKLATIVVSSASSTSPLTYSLYITRSGDNALSQTTWAGGAGQLSPVTFVSSTYSAATSVAVTGTGSLQLSAAPDTFSGGYLFERAITVTSNTSIASGTQTNFPMLVSNTFPSWASASNGGHIQNVITAPNGGQEPADLIFTSDAGCSSPLGFETESYSPSTGALVDWVEVPSLSAGSVIYACYDSSSITTNQSNPSKTWNPGYAGVWHLSEGSGNAAIDSTVNANNGTWSGSGGGSVSTYYSAGKIGPYAGYFDRGSNFVNLGAPSTFATGYSPRSMCVWGDWIAGGDGYAWIASYGSPGGSAAMFIGRGNDNSTLDGGAYASDLTLSGFWSPNVWNYVCLTYDGSTATLYANGVAVSSAAENWSLSPLYAYIGRQVNGGEYWGGLVNELRISTVAFSPSWILTDYNSENSPSTFYAVSNELGAP